MNVRLRAAGILITLVVASRAEAIPAFARKYGMSCAACHSAWPHLNQEGTIFRDNGFQLGLMKDEPAGTASAYVPLSVRTLASYQATRATNQPSDYGPITVATGGVPVPPFVDVLTAGTLAPDVSYLVVLTGFSPADGLATTESAWLRVSNLGGTGWLNLRLGKFEPDQPASAHRNIFQTAGYAAYSARFDGSAVAFDLMQNQVGFEVDGHDARSLTRYAISVFSANGDLGSASALSTPVVYAHVQRAFELDNGVLPWLRVGALGAVGWWPTVFTTQTTAAGVRNIPGTGRRHKNYTRFGGELSGIFGEPASPFAWTVAALAGHEEGSGPDTDPALATQSNRFTGGFAEIEWVPVARVSNNPTPWVIFGRYDQVRYRTGPGDFDGVSVGFRRYLALGPRASAALHVEAHADRTRGTGWSPGPGEPARDVQSQMAVLGFDLTF